LVRRREEQLVRRAKDGDTDAFAELVVAHQRFVYNLALRSLSDPREAEDVAQEAFVRAWRGLPRFRGEAGFRTWIYRIVTNLCYNRLPRLRRELTAIGDDEIADLPAASYADPLSSLEAKERRAYLHMQIEALPESYRLLVTLRYQQELSYAEIAEVVGVPLGTVKTGLFRARERLREAMRQFEEEPVWTT
jgi:RNA polymerase sigma-70 factor (ECF subfamily)